MLGPLARPLAPWLLVLAGGQGLAPPLAAAAQGPGVPAAGAGSPALLAPAPATTRTCRQLDIESNFKWTFAKFEIG